MMDHPVNRLPVFVPENGIPPPTNDDTAERLTQIDQLKYFLATATENWPENTNIKRFRLPNGEDISCVYWNDLFYITGTDIVRSLTFRFHAFGRPVTNAKKFEEGIFSDLRNLKPGTDARLEEPKSELLDMLYKHNCIRTQKKQKVFCWYAVPHDRLFLDALERDLKREKMNTEPTTTAVAEPASSLSLDSTQELFDQLRKSMTLTAVATAHALEDEGLRSIMPPAVSNSGNWGDSLAQQRSRLAEKAKQAARRSRVNSVPATIGHQQQLQVAATHHHYHHLSHAGHTAPAAATPRARSRLRAASAASVVPTAASKRLESARLSSPRTPFAKSAEIVTRHRTSTSTGSVSSTKSLDPAALKKTQAIFGSLSLFDGSPMYKQRRRRAASASSTPAIHGVSQQQDSAVPERARRHHNCHLHNTTTTALPNAPSFRGPSRLAMAAAAAGFNSGNIPVKSEIDPVSTTTNCTTLSEMTWVDKQQQQQQQQQQPQQQQQQQIEAERTYKCPQPACNQVFRRVEHLDLHLRAHAVEQPFMCSLCGKRFASSDLLTCHHQEMHEMFVYEDKQQVQPPQQQQQQPDMQRQPQQQQQHNVLSHDCATAATSCAQTPPNCSSRGSSLSPVLDLDGFTHHPPPPAPPSTAAMDTSMVLSLPTSQVMPPRLQMTSMDEDNCSSLTSSPSSIVHFGQFFQQPPAPPNEYNPFFVNEHSNEHPATSISTPFTLLSPFKPEEIHLCDQPMYPAIDNDFQTAFYHPPPLSDYNAFDVSMQTSYGYAEPVPFQYTPFVAPNDVSAQMI